MMEMLWVTVAAAVVLVDRAFARADWAKRLARANERLANARAGAARADMAFEAMVAQRDVLLDWVEGVYRTKQCSDIELRALLRFHGRLEEAGDAAQA